MVTYDLKVMNNKSRKGIYVYIKEPGHRGSYYKVKPKNRDSTPLEAYVEYYTQRFIKGNKKAKLQETIKNYKPSLKKEISKALSSPKIKKLLKKGISKTSIKAGQTATNKKGRNASKRLLKPLITDQKRLTSMSSESNMKKLRVKLSYDITFYDKENTKLFTARAFTKTPEQVVNELQKFNIQGKEVKEDSYGEMSTLEHMKMKGYTTSYIEHPGKIHHWNIQITLRK